MDTIGPNAEQTPPISWAKKSAGQGPRLKLTTKGKMEKI